MKWTQIVAIIGWALLLVSPVFGDVPLPQSTYTIDTLSELYLANFRIEIGNLKTNFETSQTPTTASFKTNKDILCDSKENVLSRGVLAKVIFDSQLKGSELDEKIDYFGCNGKAVLSEIIHVEGTSLTTTQFGDVLAGKQRSYDLKKNESRKFIDFVDSSKSKVISLSMIRQGDMVTSTFWIQNKLALIIYDQRNVNFSKIVYKVYNLHGALTHFDNYSWDRIFSINEMSITAYPNGQVDYVVSNSKAPIAFLDFQSVFISNVVNSAFQIMKNILSLYMEDLPPTQFVSGGVAPTQALQDLRSVLERLQIGDLTTAKIILTNVLGAIDKGQIKIEDNRTKK